MKNHKLFILLIVTFAVSSVFSQITKYTIEPPGIPDIYGFGISVTGYGEYAVVGAPYTHSNGIYEQGAVFVYKKNSNSVWVYDQMLVPSDSIVENHFGNRIAMNNEFILATGNDNLSENSVYIFKKNNSQIWEEYGLLTNGPNNPPWDISMSGDYAIIGGSNYGQFAIFHYDGNNWIRQIFSNDLCSSVAIDGEYAIVGNSWNNNNTGNARIFKRDGDVWNEQATLTASDAHFDDDFGNSVSIDGDYAVVGARDHNEGKGAAYIFKRDGSDWLEQKILIDSLTTGDFGTSVSIKENYVVVTAYISSLPNGQPISVITIYERVLNDWNLIYRSGEEEPWFGYQTAMTNDFIISGYYPIVSGNKAFIYEGLNIVSVESIKNIQLKSFAIHQNYPNPFNPNTTIKYQIPELSFVTLKVYDVLGNEIEKLVNEEKPVGNYEVEFDAKNLSSGIYFYRLQAGNFVETKKMVLLR